MVRLFLQTQPQSEADGSRAAASTEELPAPLLPLLQELESVLRSEITSGCRHEARLWLCNTISCIHCVGPRAQLDLFMELLQSRSSRQDVAPRLLQMIFDERPEKAGRILAKRCYMLEKFFQGHEKRILQWFDNFAGSSELGHRKGARAISRYAFANRADCWEELEWKGKHGQSPAVVATKPHYFQELDVLRSVENFLEYVPDFWTSGELAESVKDGEILKIDTKYFLDQFMKLMYEENSEDIWAVIKELLIEESFSSLSQKLLVLLDENMLFVFIKSIRRYMGLNAQCKEFIYRSCWLENLLSTSEDEVSLDELFLLNAVIAHSRQLLWVTNDEEHQEEKREIEILAEAINAVGDADHWRLMEKCRELKLLAKLKWIGLHSWILFYCLSKECKTPQFWEALFVSNGINFRKTDDYSLIQHFEYIEGCGSESDAEVHPSGSKKRRKRDRKKMRKVYHNYGSNSDRLVEVEINESEGLHSGSSWFLSTDGFSCAWNIADLPEHLSMHCFKTWMKWVYAQS